MVSTQILNFKKLAENFDFSKFEKITDIGGGLGAFSVVVAQKCK